MDRFAIKKRTSSQIESYSLPFSEQRHIQAHRIPPSRKSRRSDWRRCVHIARPTPAFCWDVRGLADIRIAPFHLLASEGKMHIDRDHGWHMGMLARLAAELPNLVVATPYRIVDLADAASQEEATAGRSTCGSSTDLSTPARQTSCD